jgi:hypothetical protein
MDTDVSEDIFSHGFTALVGVGLLYEVWRLHSDKPHSVGLLWTNNRPDAETSTWQHTTLTRDRHPCRRRESNPQSQQRSSRRPRFRPCGLRDRLSEDLLPLNSGHFLRWRVYIPIFHTSAPKRLQVPTFNAVEISILFISLCNYLARLAASQVRLV